LFLYLSCHHFLPLLVLFEALLEVFNKLFQLKLDYVVLSLEVVSVVFILEHFQHFLVSFFFFFVD